jgi:hypothetical protein
LPDALKADAPNIPLIGTKVKKDRYSSLYLLRNQLKNSQLRQDSVRNSPLKIENRQILLPDTVDTTTCYGNLPA